MLEEKELIINEYSLDINDNIIINDSEDSVTCRICGKQSKRIYGRHLKYSHNDLPTKKYKKLFPDAPISCLKDKKNISKNSGKHMKTEKYKKMFSEKVKGSKNPMHRSKTSEEFRKSISPFSIEFYNERYPDLTLEKRYEKLHEFAKNAAKDRIDPTTIEYYLKKGLNQKEAEQALKNRQTTFSKEICIEKYGEERGLEIWMNRQEKWLKNLPKLNYSKISQKLFVEIWKELKNRYNDIYFATLDKKTESIYNKDDKNFEYRLKTNESFIKPDFYIPSINKIIEFDGTYYHRNNTENKKREEKRNKLINDMNIDLLHISENDFKKNKEKTIQKCVNFILNI